MKKIFFTTGMMLAMAATIPSCKKFDSLTVSPTAATSDQVQVEYLLTNSIVGAQMDPHIAERVFVLYWRNASHQQLGSTIAIGTDDDGWSSDYYRYISEWLNNANAAIQVANEKVAAGNIKPYTNNLLQMSRIWRAYLMSEMSDNFGPIPINGFQGVNPTFSDVKTVYYFLLDELKDASAKLETGVTAKPADANGDPAYSYNYAKWKKYANSMRMRLAMRLSEVDAAKAKTEFEAAVAGSDFIASAADFFQVQEKDGWDPLTGVMSREWNAQVLSASLNNLYTGLGGIQTTAQLPASFHAAVKPADYVGLRLVDHFPLTTNNPVAPYWMDGLPNKIDPRAYKAFAIPGDFTDPGFCFYPSWDNSARTTDRVLAAGGASNVAVNINATNTFNGYNGGDWGAKGGRNTVRAWGGSMPRLKLQYRNSKNKRIFFASWETYFLIAEAAVRGWTVPMSGQAAYEKGIEESFAYWGVSSNFAAYKASTDYNRCGTSVSWTHTTEPAASYTASYVDGYTNTPGTATILYPVNTIYKNGAVKNDLLNKIITQKYIAQNPWLPLEAWSDHRRLGLPFLENPCVESGSLPNNPALTSATYMTNAANFFPQRLKYPSGLKNSNAKGYTQAVTALGGADNLFTSLWWAKK